MFIFVFLFAAILNGVPGKIIRDEATDVSHWQKTVDFDQVVGSGIQIVIHKATQGTKYVDPRHNERQKQAKDAGLKYWGAYHFADKQDGVVQAGHFLDVAKGADFYAVDLENNGNNTVGQKQAEDIVQTIIKETGRTPLIYGGAYFLNTFNYSDILAKCPLWVANWRSGEPTMPKMWTDWVLWQHTDGTSGSPPYEVPGIGKCDRDKVNVVKFQKFINNKTAST